MTNTKNRIKILVVIALLLAISSSLYTSDMIKRKVQKDSIPKIPKLGAAPNVKTSCNRVDLSAVYNYSGIVASGYLNVQQKGNSALAYIFYGQKDVKSISSLKNYPTILWLNGGPGSSSQIGNLQQIGPLLIQKQFDVKIILNNYTWANNYNILFVDQPVGTGLSYADTENIQNPFAKNLDEVADDFYRALNQLYNGDGCFSFHNFDIPASNPLIIFGESYGGKYVPAIAKKIVEGKQKGGFLTGLKGIAIGDGFTFPYQILSEVGTFSYHLGLIDFQQRMRLQKILINASRHALNHQMNALHDDFDNALEYVVQKAGNINIYDIKLDGQYEQLLQPYFRDQNIVKNIYKLDPAVVYDSNAEEIYENMYTDFMTNQINRVEFLLAKGMPVLIYNGQDDLIVQNAGTMKWVDRIFYTHAHEFRQKLFTPWKINNKVVGSMKSAGLLEFRIVNNAGHLVPMDRPVEALDMVNSFVKKVLAL